MTFIKFFSKIASLMLFCLGFTAQIHAQALVKGTPGAGQSASIVNEVLGRIGIGTASPNAGLQMANVTANRRFVLWEEVNNDHQYYGLGINSGMMRYQVANLGAFHAFFAGNSGTASTELMRIQGSGNVGIGTTAPQKRLHTVSAATNDGIQIDQTGTSNAGLYLNNTAAGGRNWGVFSSGSANTNLGGAGNFSIFDMNLLQNRFFIQGTTGNVGIGTASPSSTLHVSNPNPFAGQDLTTLQVSALSNPMIKLSSITSGTTGTGNLTVGIATCNGCFSTQAKIGDATIRLENSSNLIFNTNTSGGTGGERSFIFGAQDKIAMTIWNGGRVAIGNNIPFSLTNANHLLFVEKGILTEKVTVAVKNTADWADYVFADNYPLSKLADVEAFVKKNKHLPNVPSAQEMMTQGLDVAKMDAKLLEKIEELTLYLIELKKENDAIKTQIQSLIKNGK